MESRRQPDYSGLHFVPAGHFDSGLEHVPKDSEEKQYAGRPLDHGPQKEAVLVTGLIREDLPERASPISETRVTDTTQHRRRRRPWVLALVVIGVLLIATAIAVPLGLKFSHAGAQSATTLSPSPTANQTSRTTQTSSAQRAFSTTGTFNGTGMNVIDALVGNDEMRLYFQQFTGDIAEAFTESSTWTGGSKQNVIISDDIRNATPIAAESYQEGSNTTYHVVYLDTSNVLQDVLQYNMSGKWVPGTLGKHNFVASASDEVALAMCASDDWRHGVTSDTRMNAFGGVKIYFGGKDDVVHEVSRNYGSEQWSELFTFPPSLVSNGGIECYVPNNLIYLFGQVENGTLGYWWQDGDTSHDNSTAHPVGTWTQGSTAAVSLRANSAISYATGSYVYFQDPNDNIIGIEPNLNTSSQQWGSIFQVGNEKAVPGARIASHSTCCGKETGHITVYFQRQGDTLTEYFRELAGGKWTMDEVPVK